MNAEKDPVIFISHILESIERIKDYMRNIAKENFLKSPQVQDAVIRRIEIIGEAVRNISKVIRESYPEVSWREIAGTRDMLIHEYFAVDLEVTWNTIITDLPKLERQLKKVLEDLEKKK